MRKLQSYIIALFCTGVFAAGLGTGINIFRVFILYLYAMQMQALLIAKTEILDYDISDPIT